MPDRLVAKALIAAALIQHKRSHFPNYEEAGINPISHEFNTHLTRLREATDAIVRMLDDTPDSEEVSLTLP